MLIRSSVTLEYSKHKGLQLIKIAPNVDISEIKSSTRCKFSIPGSLKVMGQVPLDEEQRTAGMLH